MQVAGRRASERAVIAKGNHACRRRHPASRDRPRALPQLRPLGHHEPRAPRHPRRAQAGAAPDPLRDVHEPPADPGLALPQERDGRRRGDGEVPPPRRHGDLRRDGADGAAVQPPRPARQRPRQLRLARRRQPGRDALHRGQADPARRVVLRGDPQADRPVPPELRRHALRARRAPGAVPEPPRQRRHRHRRRDGDEHAAAQPRRDHRRGDLPHRQPERVRPHPRREVRAGAGLPDGRPHPQHDRGDSSRSTRREKARSTCAGRTSWRGRAAPSSRRSRTPSPKATSSRRSPTTSARGRSRRSSTSATRARTTCGSCSRSSAARTPRRRWRTSSSTRRCRAASTST